MKPGAALSQPGRARTRKYPERLEEKPGCSAPLCKVTKPARRRGTGENRESRKPTCVAGLEHRAEPVIRVEQIPTLLRPERGLNGDPFHRGDRHPIQRLGPEESRGAAPNHPIHAKEPRRNLTARLPDDRVGHRSPIRQAAGEGGTPQTNMSPGSRVSIQTGPQFEPGVPRGKRPTDGGEKLVDAAQADRAHPTVPSQLGHDIDGALSLHPKHLANLEGGD